MSCQTTIRNTSVARSIPKRRRLPQAMAIATASHHSLEAAPEPAVLARLDAIYQALQSAPDLDQAVRLPEVLAIVGISKSSWYARLNPRSPTHDPRVPRPFKLGHSPNSPSVWWRSAVVAYLNACANAQASY